MAPPFLKGDQHEDVDQLFRRPACTFSCTHCRLIALFAFYRVSGTRSIRPARSGSASRLHAGICVLRTGWGSGLGSGCPKPSHDDRRQALGRPKFARGSGTRIGVNPSCCQYRFFLSQSRRSHSTNRAHFRSLGRSGARSGSERHF